MDWYDGPLSGLTDHHGELHFFAVTSLDLDPQKQAVYFVWPAAGPLAALVIEDWALWNSWGEPIRNELSAPAMASPELLRARRQYADLQLAIRDAYIAPPYARRACAEWERDESATTGSWDGFLVRWTFLDDAGGP